ncbi:MAG: hypothetical protein JEY79_03470 [Pseudodesulfovibrio sp.]|nr:hypothetical protein [Pseudodesulfovibrio sp.]
MNGRILPLKNIPQGQEWPRWRDLYFSGRLEMEGLSLDYKIKEKHYDDKRMKRFQKNTNPDQYSPWRIGGKQNNCQDFTEKLRTRYHSLEKDNRQR